MPSLQRKLVRSNRSNRFRSVLVHENNGDDDDDFNGDYADVLSPDYQIDRRQIHMIESLGNGQFGEVYRGILKVRFELSFRDLEHGLALFG